MITIAKTNSADTLAIQMNDYSLSSISFTFDSDTLTDVTGYQQGGDGEVMFYSFDESDAEIINEAIVELIACISGGITEAAGELRILDDELVFNGSVAQQVTTALAISPEHL